MKNILGNELERVAVDQKQGIEGDRLGVKEFNRKKVL